MLLQLLTQYWLNFWNRDFFDAIERKDGTELWAQALRFVPLAAASLGLAIVSVWGRMTMQRKWREWLSNHLMTIGWKTVITAGSDASFQAGTFAGAHGSLALTAAGGWTYTLDNADTAVQALNTGGTLPDAVTVHAFDGTTASIAITIHGADEPAGNVITFGDDGNDWLAGDGGNDVMHGGKGHDVLDGDGGNDRLFGDEGNDVVRGGKGKDLIEGGAGKDWLSGGKDSDTFVFGPEFGRDVITDFHVKGSAHDVIEFSTDVFANWTELEIRHHGHLPRCDDHRRLRQFDYIARRQQGPARGRSCRRFPIRVGLPVIGESAPGR